MGGKYDMSARKNHGTQQAKKRTPGVASASNMGAELVPHAEWHRRGDFGGAKATRRPSPRAPALSFLALNIPVMPSFLTHLVVGLNKLFQHARQHLCAIVRGPERAGGASQC